MTERSHAATTLRVLDYLTRNCGTALSVQAICDALMCAPPLVQASLELLADTFLIDRQEASAGTMTYLIPLEEAHQK